MSEIKVNSVVNSTGDNDSGLDLSTNDQVIIKTANTTAVTVDSSQGVTVAGAFTSRGIDDNADATAITIDSSENVGIGTSSPATPLDVGGHIRVTGGNDCDIEFQLGSARRKFIGGDGNELELGTYSSSNTSRDVKMTIDSAGNLRVQQVYSNTTSGGANVRVQSDGLMQRDTSSQRYKNTINDATHGLTELLTLRPVTFKGNNDGDTIFGGLIAEEVHDAGLTEFVEYDEENRPDALRYSNMVSLCVKAIQELSAKVTTLETEKTELEARITALENS